MKNAKYINAKLIIYTGRLIFNIYFEKEPGMSYTIDRRSS